VGASCVWLFARFACLGFVVVESKCHVCVLCGECLLEKQGQEREREIQQSSRLRWGGVFVLDLHSRLTKRRKKDEMVSHRPMYVSHPR